MYIIGLVDSYKLNLKGELAVLDVDKEREREGRERRGEKEGGRGREL